MKKIPPTNPVTWKVFGEFIFDCREADPGYYVVNYLREAGYNADQLKRFAVAWCAFYNLGIAARASELKGPKFYELLVSLYPTAKRASERRHFRGAAGLKALAQWQATASAFSTGLLACGSARSSLAIVRAPAWCGRIPAT